MPGEGVIKRSSPCAQDNPGWRLGITTGRPSGEKHADNEAGGTEEEKAEEKKEIKEERQRSRPNPDVGSADVGSAEAPRPKENNLPAYDRQPPVREEKKKEEEREKTVLLREDHSGLISPAVETRSGLATWTKALLVGDYTSDMVPATHSVGYALNEIIACTKLLSSNVPTEHDIAAMKPAIIAICLPRSVRILTRNRRGTDLAARARRLLRRMVDAQLQDGRKVLLYGNSANLAWLEEELSTLEQDHRFHCTTLRWCNLGVKSPIAESDP